MTDSYALSLRLPNTRLCDVRKKLENIPQLLQGSDCSHVQEMISGTYMSRTLNMQIFPQCHGDYGRRCSSREITLDVHQYLHINIWHDSLDINLI
jgi:hypothetical protein